MPRISWRNFRGWLKNREIRENFLPQKFPTIRYMAILSVCFLRRARTQGGFTYSVEHKTGEGHVRVNWLKLRAPIYMYTEHVHFVDVSEVDNGGLQ